jgi:hypothetical protein
MICFKRFATDALKATQTVEAAPGVLKTSLEENWRILKTAVRRGKARKVSKPMP